PNDVTSLSLEPLVSLSSKDSSGGTPARETPANGTPARETPATFESDADSDRGSVPSTTRKSAKGSGWLSGWWSTPASGQRTPASDRGEREDDERRRLETVQEYIARTSEESKRLVPVEFRPLFGDSLDARTFRAVFWQVATQMGDADGWVLRFLRARKWDVRQVMNMIQKTLQWRAAQAMDEVSMLHHHTMDSGLAFACSVDRLGNPVYIVRVRVNVARNRSVQAIKRFLCWQIETSQLLATGPADGRVTILFDMSDFARENIDLALVRTLISLLTNYYPETLGVLLVYVNSLLFSSLWTLISPFVDPVVRSKIVMAKRPADLAPFIDPEQLPVEIGGCKEFSYGYRLPLAAENSHMADVAARDAVEARYVKAVDTFVLATRRWLDDEGEPELAAHGRAAARDALREAAFAMDPYIRAHTLYHRLGFIKQSRPASL
ncbi:phosphatidylinositol transfer protein csr1, partial [Coemansia biformis]